jgi:hypothetical protein
MSRKPDKVHYLIVGVRFDKPITRAEAVKEFRNEVHGTFYPGSFSEAEEMKIKSVKSNPIKEWWR